MSVSSSDAICIKNFLEQQFIRVSLEWVEACIQFIKEEHDRNVTLQNVKNLVYQQWLTADLEEIGVPCLPPELPTTQKTSLKGCFALQLEGIRDISRPAYSQLKELEKNTNSNAEFSAAPPATIPSWEDKPTRMLMLNLSDGCNRIQGMEHKTISSLSPNLPPGTKVLIQGPVDCRFGVLLLSAEKIKILGGEVESKLNHLSRKAILRDLLQLPIAEERDPISDASVPDSNTVSSGLTSLTSNSTTQSSYAITANNIQQHHSSNPTNPTTNQRTVNQMATSLLDGFDQNSNNNMQRSSASSAMQNMQRRRTSNGEDNNMEDLDMFENEEDDFVQSLDHSVLDEIEYEILNKSGSFEAPPKNEIEDNIWQEDEEMIQEMMAFQDDNPGFQSPYENNRDMTTEPDLNQEVVKKELFTDLSSALKRMPKNGTITIKGFIMKVLSKLECTGDIGWSLQVRIADGTATLDVLMHDKVLEDIMGVSASAMITMKFEAATDPQKAIEVQKAISRFKTKLKDYNCMMEVKFEPDTKPCVVKCYPISHVDAQQFTKN